MKPTRSVFHILFLTLWLSPALWGAATAASNSATLDSLADSWSGSFQVGNYPPLELVFHIVPLDDGGLDARLDIPSQFRTGIPAGSVTLDGNRLTMTFPAVQAEFLGAVTLDDDSGRVQRISGDWSQSGEFVGLTLHRRVAGD